jgi:hypothetical protein
MPFKLMRTGFPFSYGVLQQYYITHEPFKGHDKGVSAVGTTCSVC